MSNHIRELVEDDSAFGWMLDWSIRYCCPVHQALFGEFGILARAFLVAGGGKG